ncbi:hypothetical protein C8T65DRAFT_30570 [Cerioporus squamosus]|nr:hypothetical protein C8T65DRAFT_30570 [Cerioporus squamosus]
MPIPFLPTELIDEIIACVRVVCSGREPEKARTLLSCSLVCSEWLPASRHQLFWELWLHNPHRNDLLVSRVLNCEKMRGYLLSVRKMVLYINWNPPTSLRRPFAVEFAGHLPNVTTMTIAFYGVDTFMSHPSSFVAISRSFIHTNAETSLLQVSFSRSLSPNPHLIALLEESGITPPIMARAGDESRASPLAWCVHCVSASSVALANLSTAR